MTYTPLKAQDISTATLATLQFQLEAGTLTSEDLVQTALIQIHEQSHLNAFISIDEEKALESARQMDAERAQGRIRGPLHGIPIAVKDNIHVAGLPNTAGTPALQDFIPKEDAQSVARLRQAGAIILGKTNMHELAYGITSANPTFGAVGNARVANHIAGGSSGGSAVAIAMGAVPLSLGTDTGGSSRIPAALNGVVGYRPTSERYPNDGLTRISNTRDTVGPMARCVADIVLLDALLSEDPDRPPTVDLSALRIGVPRAYYYANLDPAVTMLSAQLLRRLTAAGVTLIEAEIDDLAELNAQVGFPIVLFETSQLLPQYLKKYSRISTQALANQIASPDVKQIVQAALSGEISAEVYQQAVTQARPRLQQAFADYFAKHRLDAIIFPTTALTARPISPSLDTVVLNGAQVDTFSTYIRNTDPASNAGIPALTLPIGTDLSGLPIGIELNGPEGADQHLLAIGAAIEALLNSTQTTP